MEPLHILLIDDEPGIVSALEAFLSREGHRVTCAGSKREALLLAGEDAPQVVLTDLRLPDGSGVEVLEELSSSSDPVVSVVMTGFPTVGEVVRAVRAGAVDVLLKPFRLREVKAAVDRCRRRRMDPAVPRETVEAAAEPSRISELRQLLWG